MHRDREPVIRARHDLVHTIEQQIARCASQDVHRHELRRMWPVGLTDELHAVQEMRVAGVRPEDDFPAIGRDYAAIARITGDEHTRKAQAKFRH
jgi:hypothetical protein